MEDMQAKYPCPVRKRVWDPVFIEFPVWKSPGTDVPSTSTGLKWRDQPEILKLERTGLLEEVKEHNYDTNLLLDTYKSQTAYDYGYKQPEYFRINKNTPCVENEYIYPSARRLNDRIPTQSAHGNTEMREAYRLTDKPATLATDKEQYKRINNISSEPPPEPYYHKDIEPLDTTYEGFEKYLDPYLTMSRLHHRPFTADQLKKPSATADIVTYHTFSNEPWVRRPKVKSDKWCLPVCSRPKTTNDKEKFKFEFREMRAHTKTPCVPGTFRTEVRDNFINPKNQTSSQISLKEFNDVKNRYHRFLATMDPNDMVEDLVVRKKYLTEYGHMNSGTKICSVLDQYKEKNKRLERKAAKDR